jgi:hypothetical protein
MAFTDTRVFEWLVTGLSAVSFILAAKLIFLGPIKVPGLSAAIAAL